MITELIALFDLARRSQLMDDQAPIHFEEGHWRPLPEKLPDINVIRAIASEIVEVLARNLEGSEMEPVRPPAEESYAGRWLFGEYTQRGSIRKIHRGFLEPLRRLPIVDNVPQSVVQFISRIPGGKDYIKRENHPGVGWHYHYLLDQHTRTDVLLAWDTRWDDVDARNSRPIFWEKHGEGHVQSRAKPRLWGDQKKRSMREMCAPDLGRWAIKEFRCASNEAEPVWPSTATLTPRPAPPVPAVNTREKKKARH